MNAKRKTARTAGTGLFLPATAACLILSCASPEAFNAPFAAERPPALPDGGPDSKGSGSGGSVAGLGGTGGAAVVGLTPGTGGGAGTRGGAAGEAGPMGAAAGQAGGGTGGGEARPDDSEVTGSGGSVSPPGPGGMAGVAVGPGGAAGGGSGGSVGSATDGSATGGRGGRGGAAGAGGGSPPATGPCAGLCTSPTVISLPHAATNLGSSATCQEAKGSIEGGNCGNFVSPRTFKVNGVTVPCTTADWTTVPPLRNDGYCFQASAGSHAYAYFVTF